MTDRTSLTNQHLSEQQQWERLLADKDAEIELLRGNLSLAEEGLANAMQEIEQLKVERDFARRELDRACQETREALSREITARRGQQEIAQWHEYANSVERAMKHARLPLPPRPSHEPNPHYVPDCITTEIPAAEPSEVLDHRFIPDGMDPGICQKCGSTKGSHRGGKRTGE